MRRDVSEAYERRFPSLERVAERLAVFVRDLLTGVPRIDRVSSRAKDPEQFAAKAMKVDKGGAARYSDPLAQIQDQIGARVVVFYESDVEAVSRVLERYFRPLKREEHLPDSPREFGYVGRHWVFALPTDVVPADVEKGDVPRFFELQVKTLFQYAWSEASHDMEYKAPTELTEDQHRRFAYGAALAWGADRVFEELWQELMI